MNWRHLFVPQANNNYTPHVLQRVAMVIMVALVLVSFAATNLHALLWQSSSWLVGAVLPAVVIDLTNQQRSSLTATPLERNLQLDEAARLKAEHMAREGYFAHYSPAGVSPWYWFETVGYTYAHAGENLAVHFSDSLAVVDAWMRSPSHRENIVSGKYTQIGVGTAKGELDGYPTVFVVQLFGTPAALPPAPVPAPQSLPQPVIASVTPAPAEMVDPVTTALPTATAQPLTSEPISVPNDAVIPVSAPVPAPVPVLVEPIPHVVVVETPLTGTRPAWQFAGYIATSSGLAPLRIEFNAGTTASSEASVWGAVATSPHRLLQILYVTLGSFVAILLLLSLVVNLRQPRPVQVVYGVGLLLLMSGLFWLHGWLTAGTVIAHTTPIELSRPS